ncbi:ATP synthase subunit f, mitochondrial-like [Mus musculus]|uniref:ATP synthase subunit f, mitochondrial-like n=1 Tax=Mus musculus TaxID=10090 RepID=UPI001676E5DC|nr:ATP synthase subunit f, mitochondrial-like [Mus musculus]
MASLVSLKEKLTEVKLGELLNWIVMRNFSPSGIMGTSQRGYSQYHKYIKVQKGSAVGLTWCWQPVWFSASAFL